MNANFTIMKNSFFLFIGRILNPAVTVAIGIFIAKSLGVEPYGQFTFILSYFFLFSMIFSLGMATIVSRDTAKEPDLVGKYFSNTSIIGIFSGISGLVIMLSLSLFFGLSPEGLKALVILGVSILPSILIYIWESLLITFERSNVITAVQWIEAIIRISLGYFILSSGYGLIPLMAVFMGSRFLSAILYFLALRRAFRSLIIKVNLITIREILSLIPTFAGLYIFSVLFSKIDVLMLALLKDFVNVGIYTAAYKLLEVSFMLPTCIITVIFPLISRYAKESPADLIEICSKTVLFSLGILLPVVIVSIFLGERIIFVVYSEEFLRSKLPFQILMVTLAFYMIDQIFSHALVAKDLQHLNLKALVTATFINIFLNAVLIPKYSYIGASLSTLISMAAMTLMHYYFFHKNISKLYFLKTAFPALPAAVSSGVFLVFKRDMPLVVALPVVFLIYFLVFLITKACLKGVMKSSAVKTISLDNAREHLRG